MTTSIESHEEETESNETDTGEFLAPQMPSLTGWFIFFVQRSVKFDDGGNFNFIIFQQPPLPLLSLLLLLLELQRAQILGHTGYCACYGT